MFRTEGILAALVLFRIFFICFRNHRYRALNITRIYLNRPTVARVIDVKIVIFYAKENCPARCYARLGNIICYSFIKDYLKIAISLT